MLRAKKTQRGVGQMAFQNFRGPAFPGAKDLIEHFLLRRVAESRKQLGSGGRRAGARVEQGDFDLPP